MDHARRVKVVERVEELEQRPRGVFRRERAAPHAGGERLPLHELRGEPRTTFELPQRERSREAAMVEPQREPRLALEGLVPASGGSGGEELQGHPGAGLEICGDVNLAAAAHPQRRLDPEPAGDDRPRRELLRAQDPLAGLVADSPGHFGTSPCCRSL
jgi:hypothetical protein